MPALSVTAGWGAAPALRGLDLDLPAGHRLGITGRLGVGQVDARRGAAAPARPARPGAGDPRRRRRRRRARRRLAPRGRPRRRARPRLRHHPAREPAVRGPDGHRRRPRRRAAPGPARRPGSTACPRASTPGWTRARCPAASAGGSPRPARCSSTRRCSCSTSPPRASTRPPPARSSPTSSTAAAGRTVVLLAHRGEGLDLVDEVAHLDGRGAASGGSGEVARGVTHAGEQAVRVSVWSSSSPTSPKSTAVTDAVAAAHSSRPASVISTSVVRPSVGCGRRTTRPEPWRRSTMLVIDVGCSCSRSPMIRIGSAPDRENRRSTSAS